MEYFITSRVSRRDLISQDFYYFHSVYFKVLSRTSYVESNFYRYYSAEYVTNLRNNSFIESLF